MSASSVATPWTERFNPLVVKELRQGLRSRTFWGPFGLLLIVGLVISLLGFSASERRSAQGEDTFVAQLVVLGIVQLLVMPVAAFRSMAAERTDETWVLLTLTGLGSRRILLGKIGSFLLQGLLFLSAAAPFVLFSYSLNGIDLVTIGVSLATVEVLHVFLVTLAVCVATLADSKLARGAVQAVALVALLQGGAAMVGLIGMVMSRRGPIGFFGGVDAEELAAMVFALVSTGVLAFEAGVSRLALHTENGSRGVRLAYLTQVFGGAVFFVLQAVPMKSHEVLVAGLVIGGVYTMTVGMLVASERDGRRRTHGPGLVSPGALRGFTVVAGAWVLVSALFLILGVSFASDSEPTWNGTPRWLHVLAAVPAFTLLYLSAPHVIGRWFATAPAQVPMAVRTASVTLVIFASVVPPLVGSLINLQPSSRTLNVLNPVVGLVNLQDHLMRPWALAVPWGAALLAVVAAVRVLRRRDVEHA